jgi:capsular polysaccharide transport system permease protein
MARSSTQSLALAKRFPHWVICFVSIIIVVTYWVFIASDRYVSESNVVLESPQIAPPEMSFGSLLGGTATNKSGDMLLLRDYLLSVDMMQIVDDTVDFREHYSNSKIDRLSRLSSDQVPLEELHKYYQSVISVELDDYSQVLRIRVQAFSPIVAQRISKLLITAGESYMNELGYRLAEEQVSFLEKQVDRLSINFHSAKKALIDYQNKYGLVSPASTVEAIGVLVAELEGQLANLKAKRAVLVSYQSSDSPEVKRVDSEISALETQIAYAQSRMAEQSGGALNVMSAEYQTLELNQQFAQESYSGALAALQNTRIEAARQLKQVSVLQSPTLPEYPVEPSRGYNSVVFGVIAIFLALITHMVILILKDHQD